MHTRSSAATEFYGLTRGIFQQHRAKLLDVLRFSNWLKSAEGMKAMKAFAVEARFQRRATDTVNPLMVAKCGMLDQMYGAYSAKMKATIIEFDEEIQEHVREIARLKKLTEEKLVAVTEEYYPASAYVELPLIMLQERAYEIYVDMSRVHGTIYFPRMPGGFESAVQQYGNRVPQEHKVEFVQRPEVFEELKKWMETAILRLAAEGQTRLAQTFRDTLAAATGERPVAATLPQRRDVMDMTNVGLLNRPEDNHNRFKLRLWLNEELWKSKRQHGVRPSQSFRLGRPDVVCPNATYKQGVRISVLWEWSGTAAYHRGEAVRLGN